MTNSGTPKFCENCGAALNESARFCHACGTGVAGAVPARSAEGGGMMRLLPFVLSLLAVTLVGYQLARSGKSSGAPSQPLVPVGRASNAPDLSSMNGDEQADRLFNRVIRLSTEGKTDSVAFFAPMAVGAVNALAPLDNHRHYDLGLVLLVSGDPQTARTHADAILQQRANHLLGLALGIRVAEATKDAARAASLRKQLLSSESTELAAKLPEYTLHGDDIKEAVRLAHAR